MIFWKSVSPSFVQTRSSPEYLIPARGLKLQPPMPTDVTAGWWSSMLPSLHHGNALPLAPWRVPRRPLAALPLLLSAVAAPVFQATTLFRQWLITVLMICECSGNVTGMTWACQCGPAGRSVSHTDIWKDTEHQPLAGENFLLPELVSVGFYVTSFLPILLYLYTVSVLPESGFQADVFCHLYPD